MAELATLERQQRWRMFQTNQQKKQKQNSLVWSKNGHTDSLEAEFVADVIEHL